MSTPLSAFRASSAKVIIAFLKSLSVWTDWTLADRLIFFVPCHWSSSWVRSSVVGPPVRPLAFAGYSVPRPRRLAPEIERLMTIDH